MAHLIVTHTLITDNQVLVVDRAILTAPFAEIKKKLICVRPTGKLGLAEENALYCSALA
jgi:hypothetical protein